MESIQTNLKNPLKRHVFVKEEPFLEHFMVPERGRSLIDVGANVGYWASFVAKKGIEVCAFEPSPQTFNILKETAKKYPNMHCFPYALGEKDSTARMEVYANSWEGGVMDNKVDSSANKTVDVSLRTLDSLSLENVGVVKIDTEGYEVPILAGATKTILEHKPRLVIEVHKGNGMAMQTYDDEFKRIKNFLKTIGYAWIVRYRRTSLREAQPFVIAYPR
jgi:FkbM family methyltransferase